MHFKQTNKKTLTYNVLTDKHECARAKPGEKRKEKKDTVPLESVSIRYRALGLAALDPQTYSL